MPIDCLEIQERVSDRKGRIPIDDLQGHFGASRANDIARDPENAHGSPRTFNPDRPSNWRIPRPMGRASRVTRIISSRHWFHERC
jgi:hypothetical protein